MATVIPASKAPLVKAWLINQCVIAATGFSDSRRSVEVVNSALAHDTDNDLITVGKVERHLTALALTGSMGAGSREESADIEVSIECVGHGSETLTDLETRAWAILSAVEAIPRTDPTCGGLTYLATVTRSSVEAGYDEGGTSHALASLTIHYQADL